MKYFNKVFLSFLKSKKFFKIKTPGGHFCEILNFPFPKKSHRTENEPSFGLKSEEVCLRKKGSIQVEQEDPFCIFALGHFDRFDNKTPPDQQDIFRPNCSSNDIFLRLKSSHCTMKAHRCLMKKGLTLFEKCHAISEGNTSRRHRTPIWFFVRLCVFQNLTN